MFKIGVVGFAVAALLGTAPAVYQLFFNGKMVMAMRLYLPILDRTQKGLAILVVVNAVIPSLGGFHCASFDGLIYVIFANLLMVSSLITGQLDDLREALMDSKTSLDNKRYRMRALILMTLKYDQ